MNKLIFLSLILFSSTVFADWFGHKNCEIFLNTKNAKDFFSSAGITNEELIIKAKESGFASLKFINTPIDQNVPSSADPVEEILELELYQSFDEASKELTTKFNFHNNIKDENGKIKSRPLLKWLVIKSKKKLFQKLNRIKRVDALEIILNLPECVLTL